MTGAGDLKRKVKPNGHFIRNRKGEILLGLLFMVFGTMLLWDAWEGRGRSMPWPLSGLMPG